MRVTREALSPVLIWAVACVPEGPRTDEELVVPPAVVDAGERITAPWSDSFDRAELGGDYNVLSPAWHLESGKLCASGAKNHGVWLTKRLPRDVKVSLDAVAGSADGDLKIEIFGDGKRGASGVSYDDATGYIAILGGWKNTLHALARLDEHGDDRLTIKVEDPSDDARARRVAPGQTYHFELERRGPVLRWLVDGAVFFELTDPEPLVGAGHEHFGFNDWDAPVCFDNLEIVPL